MGKEYERGHSLEDSLYDQTVEKLRGLSTERQANLIREINRLIRNTGGKPATVDELPMAALARRIYLFGLLLGIKGKRDRGVKSGPPSPQHQKLEEQLDAFADELRINGFGRITDHSKTVEYFCTHKVAEEGTGVEGFYALAALYIYGAEARGHFDPTSYRHYVPENEVALAYDIELFFCRCLNDEARSHGERRPFPDIPPARPESDLKRVPFFYLQHREHGEKASRLVAQFQTPRLPDGSFGDGNAHFILFRGRRSKATDLMKSFLVLKPLVVSRRDSRIQHHPTFHLYQAPKNVGGATWATPGRILPLQPGIFIIGGQHSQPLASRSGAVRDAGTPFRAIELLFFPWEEIDSSPLAGGLAMSVNKDGELLIGRICARPTLLQRVDDVRAGAVDLKGLEADIADDLEAEQAAAALATNIDAQPFLDIYERFGSLAGLAQRTAELCNNTSADNWGLAPGLLKENGEPVIDSDIEGAFERALNRIVTAGGEAFNSTRDIRIPPLSIL
jgi:hypothetical protein